MPQIPQTNAHLNAVEMKGVTCMQCKGSGWVTCDADDPNDGLDVDANGRLGLVSSKGDDVGALVSKGASGAHNNAGTRLNPLASHSTDDKECLINRLGVLAPTKSIAELSTLSTDAARLGSARGGMHAACDNYFESYTFEDVWCEYEDYMTSDLDEIDPIFNFPHDGLDDYSRVTFVGTSNVTRTSTTDVAMNSLIDFVVCDVYEEAEPTESVLQVVTEPVAPVVVVEKQQHTAKMSSNLPGTVHAKGLGLVHAQPVIEGEETWHPGFNRQLGAKGRCAILDLVRRVYRQDPEYYKAILQSRNPPSSISSLPFFNIPMLWELSHQFGIFPQALQISRNHQSGGYKTKRSLQSSSSSSSAKSHAHPKPPPKKSPKLTSKSVAPNYNAVLKASETKTQSGRYIKRSRKYEEYSVETPTRTKTHGAATAATDTYVEVAADVHLFLASNPTSTSAGSGDELEPQVELVHKHKSDGNNLKAGDNGHARKAARRRESDHHHFYDADVKMEARDLLIATATMHTPKPPEGKLHEQQQHVDQQPQKDGVEGDGGTSVDIETAGAADPLELPQPSLD